MDYERCTVTTVIHFSWIFIERTLIANFNNDDTVLLNNFIAK